VIGMRGPIRRAPKPEVLVDPDQPELPQLISRKGWAGHREVDDLWLYQHVIAAQVGDHAPAGRLHVQVPGRVLAEGSGYDETVAQRPHPYRRGIVAS
jgi:hypothetical protein